MNIRLLTIYFTLYTINICCQPQWILVPKIERNAYTVLEGTIDNKYPISMYLEYSWDWCGPNGNNRWDPRIVKGWYQYKKIGKRIPLLGAIDFGDRREYTLKLFVPDNLLDTLDRTTCLPSKYKEMFFIPECCYSNRYSLDTMQWNKYGQDGFLPVFLKEIHLSSWKTTAILSLKLDNIELLEIDFSKLTSNEYIDKIDIEASKEVEGSFYFIIRYGHLTNPGWFGSGQCGAGWEEWLGLLEINNNLEIEKFEYFQRASCEKNIDTEYIFDKSHPEKGFSIKQY